MNTKHIVAKFTVVAVALAFFSPSLKVDTTVADSGISSFEFSIINQAQAREDRKRNRNKNKNRNKNVNSNKNVNVNSNRNKNTNVNVNSNKNTNVNVNVNNNRRRGPSPLAVLTGMAIGSVIVASTMSPSCTTVIVNGIAYRKCDNTYYQPFQDNGTQQYRVVVSPL